MSSMQSNQNNDLKKTRDTLLPKLLSGELDVSMSFVDGVKQGEFKIYYKSGELQLTVNYVDNLKQGEMKGYYESGELKATVNFVDDVEQ